MWLATSQFDNNALKRLYISSKQNGDMTDSKVLACRFQQFWFNLSILQLLLEIWIRFNDSLRYNSFDLLPYIIYRRFGTLNSTLALGSCVHVNSCKNGVPHFVVDALALTSPSVIQWLKGSLVEFKYMTTLSNGPSPKRNRPQESSEARGAHCDTSHCSRW